MRRFQYSPAIIFCVTLLVNLAPVRAQESACAQRLSASAADQKFTLILFWKQNDAAAQTMGEDLKAAAASFQNQAAVVAVNLADPTEQVMVKQFGVSRAPMPLVLVVAPNGAITGRFQSKVNAETLGKALVTPTMCVCMKSLQEGRIVVVCAQPNASAAIPLGVRNFSSDPSFQSRAVVVKFVLSDPAEARFVQDLKLDARETDGAVAMLAPPGVMVGRFSPSVTKDELTAKLHAAGKCCEDENCKHHKKGAK